MVNNFPSLLLSLTTDLTKISKFWIKKFSFFMCYEKAKQVLIYCKYWFKAHLSYYLCIIYLYWKFKQFIAFIFLTAFSAHFSCSEADAGQFRFYIEFIFFSHLAHLLIHTRQILWNYLKTYLPMYIQHQCNTLKWDTWISAYSSLI